MKPPQSGLKKNKHDSRDFSFFKTKKLGGAYFFPDNYNSDAGLWMPDQTTDYNLPFGCTSMAQTDLLIDEDKKLYNPLDIENITHSNARGGIQLRESLKAAVTLHRADHPAFFNVQPDLNQGGVLDWFDAMRAALIIGKPEGRAVSVGTPWFPEFMNTKQGVIKAFLDWSLARVSWHNWNVKGWATIDGKVYLICKPWCGRGYGDGGYAYFDRATFNRLMNVPGTVAFVLDKLLPGESPQKIDSTVAQWLTSLFARIFKLY